MFNDKETDFGEMSKQAGILKRDHLSPTREMRWTKLVDSAERSLYWLIPAVTLAYIVFRILPLLSSQ
jgi:hypothetical protein